MRERLLQLLARRPFRPFRLHLSNGIQHTIVHPEQAVLTGAHVDLSVPNSPVTEQTPIDSVFVALIHVVQIEPLPAPPAATMDGANGQQG
jgi:hypothetical protein